MANHFIKFLFNCVSPIHLFFFYKIVLCFSDICRIVIRIITFINHREFDYIIYIGCQVLIFKLPYSLLLSYYFYYIFQFSCHVPHKSPFQFSWAYLFKGYASYWYHLYGLAVILWNGIYHLYHLILSWTHCYRPILFQLHPILSYVPPI